MTIIIFAVLGFIAFKVITSLMSTNRGGAGNMNQPYGANSGYGSSCPGFMGTFLTGMLGAAAGVGSMTNSQVMTVDFMETIIRVIAIAIAEIILPGHSLILIILVIHLIPVLTGAVEIQVEVIGRIRNISH